MQNHPAMQGQKKSVALYLHMQCKCKCAIMIVVEIHNKYCTVSVFTTYLVKMERCCTGTEQM